MLCPIRATDPLSPINLPGTPRLARGPSAVWTRTASSVVRPCSPCAEYASGRRDRISSFRFCQAGAFCFWWSYNCAACSPRMTNRLNLSYVKPALTRRSSITKAHDGNRTHDLFLTKEVLYRLSYVGIASEPLHKIGVIGAGNGTRTRDPELGRLALYQLSYSRSPLHSL
jgi:hypothetical protein